MSWFPLQIHFAGDDHHDYHDDGDYDGYDDSGGDYGNDDDIDNNNDVDADYCDTMTMSFAFYFLI